MNNFSNMDQLLIFLKTKEKEYEKSRQRIKEVCSTLNYTHLNDTFFRHILVDSRHKLMMCKHDKVHVHTLKLCRVGSCDGSGTRNRIFGYPESAEK